LRNFYASATNRRTLPTFALVEPHQTQARLAEVEVAGIAPIARLTQVVFQKRFVKNCTQGLSEGSGDCAALRELVARWHRLTRSGRDKIMAIAGGVEA
jgi:hypothetical protein